MLWGLINQDGILKNVNHDRDFKPTQVGDLRLARVGDPNPEGSGVLESVRGIEVGHIFYLGTKYSQTMNATFLDSAGKRRFMEMGCYGVGISRTVQAVVEQSHDENGIIWPSSIAPYDVHICLLDSSNAQCLEIVDKVCSALSDLGKDVLVDDRPQRPGVKFKDADLLGMPLRLNVGARELEKGQVEVVVRKTKTSLPVETSRVIEVLKDYLLKV